MIIIMIDDEMSYCHMYMLFHESVLLITISYVKKQNEYYWSFVDKEFSQHYGLKMDHNSNFLLTLSSMSSI